MSFAAAVSSALSQYASFSGRARRSEYWWFILFSVIVAIVAVVLDAVAGTDPLFYAIALVFLAVPSLAVGCRRLHDIGKSGWLQLVYIIPLVGWILQIVWGVRDSAPDNEYGPSPKHPQGSWA